MSVSQGFCLLCVAVFALGLAVRAVRYSRAPMHLRWELYPVPHEAGKPYGGSYYEEPDWWRRPRKTSFLGDLKVMLSEIFLHAGLWHHNRKMWMVSYPFHLGIYCVAVFLLLLVAGGVAGAAGPLPGGPAAAASSGLAPAILHYLTLGFGLAGMLLVIVGGLGVLARRLANRDLRSLTAPADYFNLGFILALAVTWFVTWLCVDPSFALARGFVRGVFDSAPATPVPPAVAGEMVLLGLFLVYLPFTHMSHFMGKWFTYHHVRWDDSPNLGAAYERKVAAALNRPVGWSAPHISNPGKKKTWAELAREVE